MSLVSTDRLFARRLGTLWRDTGVHVLALPEDDGTDVVVLGGGSALLWRLLESPLALEDLLQRIDGSQGAPSEREVADCLEDLVGRGLVEGISREHPA